MLSRLVIEAGGRFVIPVGRVDAERLVKLMRRGADALLEQDLGGFSVVPLVGA